MNHTRQFARISFSGTTKKKKKTPSRLFSRCHSVQNWKHLIETSRVSHFFSDGSCWLLCTQGYMKHQTKTVGQFRMIYNKLQLRNPTQRFSFINSILPTASIIASHLFITLMRFLAYRLECFSYSCVAFVGLSSAPDVRLQVSFFFSFFLKHFSIMH